MHVLYNNVLERLVIGAMVYMRHCIKCFEVNFFLISNTDFIKNTGTINHIILGIFIIIIISISNNFITNTCVNPALVKPLR